jgi:hypothetical protein
MAAWMRGEKRRIHARGVSWSWRERRIKTVVSSLWGAPEADRAVGYLIRFVEAEFHAAEA